MVTGLSGLFSSNEAKKVTAQSCTSFSCKIAMMACCVLGIGSPQMELRIVTGEVSLFSNEVENGLFCSCHVAFKMITGQPCSPQMK